MKRSIVELPSGKMVNLDNIIYVSEVKEHSNFFDETDHRFDVLWAGGERVTMKFDNKENCILEWENLKVLLKNHTKSLICG